MPTNSSSRLRKLQLYVKLSLSPGLALITFSNSSTTLSLISVRPFNLLSLYVFNAARYSFEVRSITISNSVSKA
jgi:hypothetical protein